MKVKSGSIWLSALRGAIAASCFASVCLAGTAYSVTMNTTALIGRPIGPVGLNYQLIGADTDTSGSIATYSNFRFEGDNSGGPDLIGGATGGGTDIALTDVAFLNSFTQQFSVAVETINEANISVRDMLPKNSGPASCCV